MQLIKKLDDLYKLSRYLNCQLSPWTERIHQTEPSCQNPDPNLAGETTLFSSFKNFIIAFNEQGCPKIKT